MQLFHWVYHSRRIVSLNFCVFFALSLPADADEWSMHTFQVRSWYKLYPFYVNCEHINVCYRLCIRVWAGPWVSYVRWIEINAERKRFKFNLLALYVTNRPVVWNRVDNRTLQVGSKRTLRETGSNWPVCFVYSKLAQSKEDRSLDTCMLERIASGRFGTQRASLMWPAEQTGPPSRPRNDETN